jgi:hypothetical protein
LRGQAEVTPDDWLEPGDRMGTWLAKGISLGHAGQSAAGCSAAA